MSSRGFVSLEFLAGYLVVLTLLPVLVSLFGLLARLSFNYYPLENELAFLQLRRILLASYELKVDSDYLSFRYNDDECFLYLHNRHLILTPGTQIFAEDVEDVYFYVEGGVCYCRLIYEDGEYVYPLAKAEWFCLADFPDNANQLPAAD